MADKYKPFIRLIPEDDANRQIALALMLELGIDPARYKILPPARGWLNVLESFKDDHLKPMRRYVTGLYVLVIDYDNDAGRLQRIKDLIPSDVAERVFVLGTLSEPEYLKPDFGSFDDIGTLLGRQFGNIDRSAWGHPLLIINAPELVRIQADVCPKVQ